MTSNYLTVELAAVEPARRFIDVEIGGLTEGGLRQASPFLVLNSAV
jgi:hypothetical protein